jgi:magnesium chelatase family protein
MNASALMDRTDLHVEVPLVDLREFTSNTSVDGNSSKIRKRVVLTRSIQQERFSKIVNTSNSSMSLRQMKTHCQIDSEASYYLEFAMEETLSSQWIRRFRCFFARSQI